MDSFYDFLKKRGKIHTALFSFLVCGALLVPQVSFGAFGASPPVLNATRLVPGIKYQQIIYLARDNAENDLVISADLDVPDTIKEWVRIEQGSQFIIPRDVRQFPITVLIDVPSSAGLGIYNGRVTFSSVPNKEGQQVAISLGIEIPLNLTVGDNISREVKVRLIKLLDIEEGWDPRVYVKFENLGNISEKFDSANYELLDNYGNVRLAFAQKTEDFPETPAFSTNEYTIDFPMDFHLGVGQYWAVVNFYQEGKVIGSQKTIFNVLKRGSLSSPAGQLWQVLRLQEFWMFYLGGLVLIILYFLRRRFFRKSV